MRIEAVVKAYAFVNLSTRLSFALLKTPLVWTDQTNPRFTAMSPPAAESERNELFHSNAPVPDVKPNRLSLNSWAMEQRFLVCAE